MATVGIDLGTTNSLVSVWQDDKCTLIPNNLGEYLTPSVVGIDENGEMLVGRTAKERLISHPESTVASFKRFMGTEKTFMLGNRRFTAADLSSMVLRQLKEDAEKYLGESVEEAVISVPAYFNDFQRNATKMAGELAGLTVERLVNEPSAAALAYRFGKTKEDQTFLVFDFGGGTLDISIVDAFDSVIEIVKGMLLNRELNFEVHREPLQNPYVMTEPVRIREILVNILNNAVKFTKDGGTIRFDAGGRPGVDAQHIVICYRIKDTGIGMSEDFQKKIFDEFAQEENGVRTQYKGTGLGMPISKKYIELMGGTITVDSRKGVGTTFTVEIPMELTNAEKVEKTKPLVQHNDLKGIKVLLAEDNDLNAELATMLLEDLGMTVTRAADGQEVVDLFAEYPAGTYDIILMDIMMPKMDGHQAAKAIRAMYADRPDAEEIPIIALSANAFSEDVQASQDAGMNGHVSKPLNMEEVTKVIERNLNRP